MKVTVEDELKLCKAAGYKDAKIVEWSGGKQRVLIMTTAVAKLDIYFNLNSPETRERLTRNLKIDRYWFDGGRRFSVESTSNDGIKIDTGFDPTDEEINAAIYDCALEIIKEGE